MKLKSINNLLKLEKNMFTKASKSELLTAAMDWLGKEDPDAFLTFRHFRKFDNYAQLAPKGGATFCAVALPTKGKLIFAYALCSDKDMFNKALGREISYGRLTADSHTFETAFQPDVPISRQIEDYIWSAEVGFNIDDMAVHRTEGKYLR
jgi:hypothetical protein